MVKGGNILFPGTKQRSDVNRVVKKKYNEMLRKDSEGITPLNREKPGIG